MKNEEIVRALRCISTAGGENACEHCPYWKEEEVPEEERPIYGADTMHSCDVDRVGLDGADLIERLTDRCARYAEEIAVLQERTRWIPVTERLPEVESWYLVAILDKKLRKTKVEQDLFAIELAERYGHDAGFCKDNRWKDREELIAWMPLPEPPKEVE